MKKVLNLLLFVLIFNISQAQIKSHKIITEEKIKSDDQSLKSQKTAYIYLQKASLFQKKIRVILLYFT